MVFRREFIVIIHMQNSTKTRVNQSDFLQYEQKIDLSQPNVCSESEKSYGYCRDQCRNYLVELRQTIFTIVNKCGSGQRLCHHENFIHYQGRGSNGVLG